MTESRVRYLIQQFFRNQCTPQEKGELASWIHQSENDSALKEILEEIWKEYEPVENMPGFKADAVLSAIFSHTEEAEPIETSSPVRFIWWKRIAAAAILILVLGTGSYLLFVDNHKQVAAKAAKQPAPVYNDASPGRQKAILTLSDGAKIVLDTASSGVLAQQGNTEVINRNGELVYSSPEKNFPTMLYNTLNTHRGELYPLMLSDGSKVWLNAASSIRFPVAFNDRDRVVEITGEAYFEVARNPGKPFKVKLNGMEIEVLGTHFNVNAYADELTIKTTLIEGSVKITRGNASLLLAPGDQAGLVPNGKINLFKKVDVEEAISWKNGYFHFSNASLETVMRQLSRWYDVDVEYESKQSGQIFRGDIPKSLQLSQVLKILERSQVHSKINGKKIIVLR